MAYLRRLFAATEEENRRAILSMLPGGRGGELLDVGTGDGAFAARVGHRLGAERVVGVELIPNEAAQARSRGIDVREGDLDDGLPFPDDSFTTVHANQVIEHVRGTDRLVSEIRRVLAPGGLACISTNNLSSWHNVVSLALGYQPMPMHVSDALVLGNPLDPQRRRPHAHAGRVHLRLFTPRALRELCEHHGLRTLTLRTAGYYPLPPRIARVAGRIDPLHGAFLIGLFERPAA
jgi:SAM-dependent methyltransferase